MPVSDNVPLDSFAEQSLQEPLLQDTSESNTGTTATEAGMMTTDHDGDNDDHDVEATTTTIARLCDGLPLSMSLLIKSLYFLDALGSSTWGRFSAIYYNLHNLNSAKIGLIECLRTAVPTLSMVAWGVVADRFHCRKNIWLVTKTASTAILLMLALPWVYQSFWRILAVSVAAQLFVSNGLLDAYTLELLGTEHKLKYGKYRLYASLSWGLGSIVMGWVTDRYSFDWNFLLFAILGMAMIFLVAACIPGTSTMTNEQPILQELSTGNDIDDAQLQVEPVEMGPQVETIAQPPDGRVMDMIMLAFQPRIFIFLLEVVVMGAAMATVERLLFLYMVNDLQASTFLCGLSVGVNVLFELPIFWWATPIMSIIGHDGMFILAMSCFVVRVYGYTLLTPETRWWILALEIMHGVTFACFWIVTTDISKVLVHRTEGAFWGTAIPSSVQMLYSALGVSLGSVLGGWAMHRYGSRRMYTITAGIVLCMLVVQVMGSILNRICCNTAKSFLPCEYLDPDNPTSDQERNHDREETENFTYSRLGNRHDRSYNDNKGSLHLTMEHAFGIIENGALLSTD